jgi:CHRD domain-containing protein
MFVPTDCTDDLRENRSRTRREHRRQAYEADGRSTVRKLALLVAATAAAALLVVSFAGAAENYTVGATLKNNTEVPRAKGATFAKGSFTGKYVENKTGATLTWKLTFSRLTGKALAAHIHKGKRGQAGPVVVPLCGPCRSGQVGKVHISKAVVAALEGNNAYVNVHTAKNAAGEIRGQVKVSS